MVVVVARSGKALSAHVTGVRFFTLGRRDVNKSKRKTKEKEIRTSMQKKKRYQERDKKNLGKGNTHKYAKKEETSTNGIEKLRKRKYAPVCKRMWYIRPTLVVSILLQCGHFSCWPPVCKKWVRIPPKYRPKYFQNIKTLWLTLGSGSPGLVLVMLIPLCPSSNKISE